MITLSILTFLFEDNTVAGGYRFWIGIVNNIVVKKNNKAKSVWDKIFLNEVPDGLLINCKWLEPILEARGTINEATRYKYLDFNQNRDYVEGKFIINVIEMENEIDEVLYLNHREHNYQTYT
jgi:hypothetical protein